MGTNPGDNINVELRLLTEEKVAVLFGESIKGRKDNLYLLGRVTNRNMDSVYIKLQVTSPNNPTLRVNNIGVGWIPPKGSSVYFLEYLMQPILRTKLSEVQLEYIILSVTHK